MQVKKAEKKGGKVFSGVSGTGVWKQINVRKLLVVFVSRSYEPYK